MPAGPSVPPPGRRSVTRLPGRGRGSGAAGSSLCGESHAGPWRCACRAEFCPLLSPGGPWLLSAQWFLPSRPGPLQGPQVVVGKLGALPHQGRLVAALLRGTVPRALLTALGDLIFTRTL